MPYSYRWSQVFRQNHVGDWGTPFGKLINYMNETYPNFLADPPDIASLATFYKAASLRFEESEDFAEVGNLYDTPCFFFLLARIHVLLLPLNIDRNRDTPG